MNLSCLNLTNSFHKIEQQEWEQYRVCSSDRTCWDGHLPDVLTKYMVYFIHLNGIHLNGYSHLKLIKHKGGLTRRPFSAMILFLVETYNKWFSIYLVRSSFRTEIIVGKSEVKEIEKDLRQTFLTLLNTAYINSLIFASPLWDKSYCFPHFKDEGTRMQRPSNTPISRHCQCSAVSAVSLWTSLVGLGNSSSVLWLLPTSSTWMSFYLCFSVSLSLCLSSRGLSPDVRVCLAFLWSSLGSRHS